MPHVKDGVELLDAKPVPRPGRWVGAGVVAVIVAMAVHGLVTNPNYQWSTVWAWLFSQSIMSGGLFTSSPC